MAGAGSYFPVSSAFAVNAPAKMQQVQAVQVVSPQKVNANMQLTYELALPVQVNTPVLRKASADESINGVQTDKAKTDVQIALASPKIN